MKYGELNLGQVEAIVNKLGGMDGVQRFLAGHSEVVTKKYVINCNADPFVPDGWRVEEHQTSGPRNTGLLEWNVSKVSLYLSKKQQGGSIEGNKLREELKGKPVFNATVLDYLLANPDLIPEEWKGKAVFFWGTVYRYSDGFLCVRFLCWHGGRWYWGDYWLGHGWYVGNPAAVSVS